VARMRWIKQMGLACLVFPGANHTRFEHSLGTMHVADVLSRHLLRGQREKLGSHTVQEIRLAALLHDIGHTPFSHVVEEFFRRFPQYAPTIDQYDHEQYTTEIIGTNQEIEDICDKETVDLPFVSRLAVGKSKTFLDVLISGCLDADKIDYVVRDSYYCGLPYGNVDILSLAEGIRLSADEEGNSNVVFDENSRNAAEGLLTSRFYLMTTVHSHNSNCAANLLLFRAIAEAYDKVLEATTDTTDSDVIKDVLSRAMHLKWVDHDLIAFLRNPVETLRLTAVGVSKDERRKYHFRNFEPIIEATELSWTKPYSSILLDQVLSSRVPPIRSSYPLAYFSPGARYDLYLIFRFAQYTEYFVELEKSIKQLLGISKRKGVYTDITFPRYPDMSTIISTGKGKMYLYDASLLLRSLVLQSATKLSLSIYSFKRFGTRVVRTRLENVIHGICHKIRRDSIKRKKWIGTDLLLLIYYYIHEFARKPEELEPRLFFKGDTRFQAFAGQVLRDALPKKTFPYQVLEEIIQHYGNINKHDTFEEFRQRYPELYSVALVQDLDLLAELGLLYTRSGTVQIWETREYQRRYERRISRLGREHVASYIGKTYPFSAHIKDNISRIMKEGGPLLDLGS